MTFGKNFNKYTFSYIYIFFTTYFVLFINEFLMNEFLMNENEFRLTLLNTFGVSILLEEK